MFALNKRSITTNARAGARAIGTIFSGIRASTSHRWLGGPEPVRVLLVTDGLADATSEQQLAPVYRHSAALRQRYGIVVEHVGVQKGMALQRSDLASVDILGLKLSFMTPSDEAIRITRHFRGHLAGLQARLVYFDGDDDLCIQWPEVLDQVDCYVKKHVFSDLTDYGKRYNGKSNLTDYVVREHGRSFKGNVIESAGPVREDALRKLYVGWNIALDDKIADLATSLPPPSASRRNVDVVSRAFVREDVWIYPLRGPLVERMGSMQGKYQVLVPRERVSQEQYYEEMLRSRICVSPFGYGELCWRDFEAILCGCMLVKPDMSHVRTHPDIFVPGDTYAPVKWDYSDLAEVCARYLDDEAARQRVAERAREVLMNSLGETAFVQAFGSLLGRLGLPRNARGESEASPPQ